MPISKSLAGLSVLLLGTLLAALRPRWTGRSGSCGFSTQHAAGIAVYLTFFWKVFS